MSDIERPINEEKLFRLVMMNVISANHTIYQIEQLTHQDRIWLKELKNYGNLFLKRLMKTESHFDYLAEEEAIVWLYNSFHDFMDEINTIDIEQIKKNTNVIRALKKDEKSMIGIAKKVLGDKFEE